MKNQSIGIKGSKQKRIIIFSLYLGSAMIMFLGFFFSAYSVMNNITLQVLNTSVHGIVFGILVAYLGIRYYFMVTSFETEFLANNDKFSWSNFKKEKSKRKISGTKKIKLITGR